MREANAMNEDPKMTETLKTVFGTRCPFWKEAIASGASDEEIAAILRDRAFYGDCGGGGPDIYWYATSAARLKVWIGSDAGIMTGFRSRKMQPALQGQKLIQTVRQMLDIPLPGGIKQLELF